MANDRKNISFPNEIVSFFNRPSGRSLMIRGSPGTGKTTFALQLLEELADPDKSLYLSTRVSDEALYSQFPWLEAKEMKNRIVDSSRIFLKTLYSEGGIEEIVEGPMETPILTSAKGFLKDISDEKGPPTKVDRTRLSAMLEKTRMPEIESTYDRVEFILPEKTTLIIDSVEGVTHKYNIDAEEFITVLQKDLVENSNTDLILVLEKAEIPQLEYLVDGVMSLSMSELEGRRVREGHFIKLRATEIRQPSYLLTLQNGRFTCFEPFCPDRSKANGWETKPDTTTHYSTGISDLDALLDGGFRKGSYNVIEIGHKVSNQEYYAVVIPILLNFISQNRGVVAVLTGGDHAETTRAELLPFLSEEQFDRYVRIADYFLANTDKPYIMALGTRNKEEALKTWKENLASLRGAENKPILDYTGFDTLEYLRGDTIAIKDLLNAVAKTKISQDLGLGIIKPGLKLTQEIMNMADTYLRIVDIDKCPCIYGVKPKTMIYAIVTDKNRGYPNIRLVPIV
ncbi:MAG: gas vesicle protein GvpD P-loop domain-containing protein [Thermoplasmata archaeon]